MGKRTSKTTQTTENRIPPWVEAAGRSNYDTMSFLTSNIVNRYGQPGNLAPTQGAPNSFVADFSPDSQNAFAKIRAYASGETPGQLRGIGDQYADLARRTRQPGPNVREIAEHGPYLLDPMTDVGAAQVGAVGDISAQRGAEFLESYRNPWEQQVVDTSLADYDVGADRSRNDLRARRDSGAAFGDRAALADAVFAADAARGRGGLAANLRSQGFNTAANLGMQDAGRAFEAARSNQNVAMQRAIQQAQFNQQAALANAQRRDDAGRFNIDSRYRNDQQRINAALSQAGLDREALGLEGGFIGNQAQMLQAADAQALQQAGALRDIGAVIDEKEQERLDEPLRMLALRSQMLGQTPYPTSQYSTGTQKMSGLDALGKIVGIGGDLLYANKYLRRQ
ncbi:MAG: hypothetical protein SFV21_17740 [Rhodospirillaceae bacterium]|nr:hypothetical protein [Rhodospirillaceae bacterium]